MLADIQEHGWHVVGISDDEVGPGFSFTVGVYLRTLQPEILMMGTPIESSHRVLNAVAEYLMEGARLLLSRDTTDLWMVGRLCFGPFTRASFVIILDVPSGSTGHWRPLFQLFSVSGQTCRAVFPTRSDLILGLAEDRLTYRFHGHDRSKRDIKGQQSDCTGRWGSGLG